MAQGSASQLNAQQDQILARIRKFTDEIRGLDIAISEIPFEPGLDELPEVVAERSQRRIELQRQRARLQQQVKVMRAELLAIPVEIAATVAAGEAGPEPVPQVPVSKNKILVARAAALTQQLRQLQVRYNQTSRARAAQSTAFGSRIKKAAFIVTVAVLFIAGIADLLSIVDFGWLISWIIPIIGFSYVRRINTMNTASEAMAAAMSSQKKTFALLSARLRPAAVSMGRADLLRDVSRPTIGRRARSYMTKFIFETLAAQLLELIPIIDILPMYLAEVAALLWDQHRAYRSAVTQFSNYREVIASVDALERFEIQFLAFQISVILNTYQNRNRQERRTAQATEDAAAQEPLVYTTSPSLGFAT